MKHEPNFLDSKRMYILLATFAVGGGLIGADFIYDFNSAFLTAVAFILCITASIWAVVGLLRMWYCTSKTKNAMAETPEIVSQRIIVTGIEWDAPKRVLHRLPNRLEIDITTKTKHLLEDIDGEAVAVFDYIAEQTGRFPCSFYLEVEQVPLLRLL